MSSSAQHTPSPFRGPTDILGSARDGSASSTAQSNATHTVTSPLLRPCDRVGHVHHHAPFTPVPAIGDAFIGRQGLVRNLRGRIARGEPLAVIGGPKLGKTSLVRTALHGLPTTR